MKAATNRRRQQRLLAVSRNLAPPAAVAASDLTNFLSTGDLVVVNDAATLPASIAARFGFRALEVRLVRRRGPSLWQCVLFGDGSWRDDTSRRGAPPTVPTGALLRFGASLRARVSEVSSLSARLVTLQFDVSEPDLLSAVYTSARPIQYSYHEHALPLSWLQSPYAGRPWSVEMPSAGRAMTWTTIMALRKRGVRIARLTHAAGLSATGVPGLDALLPFPEHYDIPRATTQAIARTRQRGGRVIAVGTTVVRALEGCVSERGGLMPGEGETRLIIDSDYQPRVVDGVLAGLHAPDESHFKLLSAFAPKAQLARAWTRALHLGYQNHELGDAMLVA